MGIVFGAPLVLGLMHYIVFIIYILIYAVYFRLTVNYYTKIVTQSEQYN